MNLTVIMVVMVMMLLRGLMKDMVQRYGAVLLVTIIITVCYYSHHYH